MVFDPFWSENNNDNTKVLLEHISDFNALYMNIVNDADKYIKYLINLLVAVRTRASLIASHTAQYFISHLRVYQKKYKIPFISKPSCFITRKLVVMQFCKFFV